MKSIVPVFIILTLTLSSTFFPVFAQSDQPSDKILTQLLNQRDSIKKEMETANAKGDYDKYKQLEEQWNQIVAKITAREELVKNSQRDAKRLLDEATSLKRDKKYPQAQAKYEQLLKYTEFIGEDKIPGLKLMIALCLELQKDYAAAEKTYSAVILLDPKSAEAFSGKARSLSKMGKDSEAVNFFKKAIEFDPTDYQNYFFLAQSYEKIDMLEDAETNYQISTQKSPDYYKAWYNLGVLRFKMKKYEEAVSALKSAVNSDTKYQKEFHKAYTLIAQIYNALGKYPDALNAAESAINLLSNYGPAHLEKGIALEKSESYNQAIQAFEKCLNDRNCRDSAQWHINLIKEKYLSPQQPQQQQ